MDCKLNTVIIAKPVKLLVFILKTYSLCAHPNTGEVNYLQMCMKRAGKAWNYYLLSILRSVLQVIFQLRNVLFV